MLSSSVARTGSKFLLRKLPLAPAGNYYGTRVVVVQHPKPSSLSSRNFSSAIIDEGEHDETSNSLSSLLFNPTEEHLALRSMLRSFVEKEVEGQALEHNNTETFNLDLFRKLGTNAGPDSLGILGLTVPEEYGGTGFVDATAVSLVHEELSYSDPAFCLSYLAHSLLFVNNLAVNGTHEQKLRFLPEACDGSKIAGMCMSEPNAGTDVLGMKTNAKYDPDSKGWILNGTKMWITNGTLYRDKDTGIDVPGDVFLVYARTGPQKTDITSFIVEKEMSGFSVGQKINNKLGMRASNTAELLFDNVFVPCDNAHIVGGDEAGINNATLCMMRNLEIERLGLAAMSIGIARRCIDEMKNYALDRSAFGKTSGGLYNFGQIQRKIAKSYSEYMAGKCYVYATANTLDLNSTGNTLNADGTKLFAAGMSKTVADRAIQVLGGNGYIGDYIVERLWRDSKLLEIGGGTNESHHKNMSRDLRTKWIKNPIE